MILIPYFYLFLLPKINKENLLCYTPKLWFLIFSIKKKKKSWILLDYTYRQKFFKPIFNASFVNCKQSCSDLVDGFGQAMYVVAVPWESAYRVCGFCVTPKYQISNDFIIYINSGMIKNSWSITCLALSSLSWELVLLKTV